MEALSLSQLSLYPPFCDRNSLKIPSSRPSSLPPSPPLPPFFPHLTSTKINCPLDCYESSEKGRKGRGVAKDGDGDSNRGRLAFSHIISPPLFLILYQHCTLLRTGLRWREQGERGREEERSPWKDRNKSRAFSGPHPAFPSDQMCLNLVHGSGISEDPTQCLMASLSLVLFVRGGFSIMGDVYFSHDSSADDANCIVFFLQHPPSPPPPSPLFVLGRERKTHLSHLGKREILLPSFRSALPPPPLFRNLRRGTWERRPFFCSFARLSRCRLKGGRKRRIKKAEKGEEEACC